MPGPIIYVDRSRVREGKLPALRPAIEELVAFVQANEPQLISYGFFFNEEGTAMTVVAVHADSASMEFHMSVAGPAFRKFVEYIDLQGIEIYGEPGETVLERLREKARLLGKGTVAVHRLDTGFARFVAR